MKTIGLIGGMSWESTALYYERINIGIKKKLGGLHSGRILMYSLDFEPIEALQAKDDWQRLGAIMIDAAKRLQDGGADFILICTNTMHRLAEEVTQAVEIPLLHIADATADQLVKDGIRTVGLLGTAYTMEMPFYRQRLSRRYDLEVLIPDLPDRKEVHRIIYDELCQGQIKNASKQTYIEITHRLADDGVRAVILGCTEIGMLIKSEDVDIPLYDTTQIHADAAVRFALNLY